MKSALRLVFVVGLVVGLAACSQVAPKSPSAPTLGTQSVSGSLRTLVPAGTSQFVASPAGTASGIQNPEFPTAMAEQDAAAGAPNGRVVNRIPQKSQVSLKMTGANTVGIVQGLTNGSTFEGLNLYDQRIVADNGNQFTVEPPDQGLCVGNGYVLEAVNDVAQVYTASDHTPQGIVSLNQFFGYPSAIDRTGGTGAEGPFVTDPSCHYDATSGRWFLTVLTLQQALNAQNQYVFTGVNTIDLAVSNSSDPTGDWTIYHLDVTNDGASTYNLGDYPHFAVDANGVYITTDSFPFFDAGYNGAWLYAVSKQDLLSAGTATYYATPMVDAGGVPGYSVAPAIPVGTQTATANGTEYFTSATTVYQSSGNQIDVWALDGTASLNTATPSLTLSSVRVPVATYGDPSPYVPQQSGSVPLADLLNSRLAPTLFGSRAPNHQQEGPIATNDSGMKQTMFVGGHLWAALSTVTQGARSGGHTHGANQTGVAWYDLTPSMSGGSLSASLANSGLIAPVNADLLFPAIAMNPSGQGAIAVTLTGNHNYPSAAYVPITSDGTTGDIVVTNAGVGPQDGFTEYWIGGGRPRWGDYGAGAVDASGNLWIASEDINQTCSFADFLTDMTCGGTRAPLGNWSTQITELPQP